METKEILKKLIEKIDSLIDKKNFERSKDFFDVVYKSDRVIFEKSVEISQKYADKGTEEAKLHAESILSDFTKKVSKTLKGIEENVSTIELEGKNFIEFQEITKTAFESAISEIKESISDLEKRFSEIKLEKGEKGERGDKGDPGEKGIDGSPDTPEEIRDKLETLKGEDRLDAKAIKNLEKQIKVVGLSSSIKRNLRVAIKTTDYSLISGDDVIVFTENATLTLPKANGKGELFYIRAKGCTVEIQCASGETLNEETSQTIFPGEAVQIIDESVGSWGIY